ncbi:MAG: hypothetical protein A3F72_14570 [Bacteroidetes bacterium RIFCSPLOWO2_12_FULL_35_15]|nr:MAG: hypothetical protein A3F72_14570 [Bacteroidetes bacterium RIFCSPLOWO2_12_FULL_35_15]
METQLNVLIAEDEFIVAKNIKQQVLDLGHNVVGIVSNAEDVFKVIKNSKVDLILMDVMLQGPIDGIEIARKVKEIQPISFLFITAYSSEDHVKRARLLEPHGYLLKPFTNRDLSINIELAAYKHTIEQKLREARLELESLNQQLEEKVSLRTEKLNETNQLLLKEIKKRKQNEDKLIASENKYKELTEFLPIPVMETNKTFKITYANIATYELFEINKSQDLQLLTDLFPQSENEHLKETIEQCKVSSKVIVTEFTGKKTNSSYPLSLIVYFTPIHSDASFSGLRIAFLDISQRVSMESQLSVLSLAVEQAKECIVITDKESKIEYVNQAALNEYGFSFCEMIGKTPQALKSGFHEDAFFKKLWETIVTGKTFDSVFVNKRKNQELFYEEKTIAPLKNKKGEIIKYIATGRNITEKIKAEKKANENQKFINSINNSAPIIIFIFNIVEDKLVFVNNQIFSILGYLSEEICNSTLAELVNYCVDNTKHFDIEFLAKINLKKGYAEEIIRVKHKQSGLKWMNIRIVEFKSDEAGNIIEIIGSATDVTEQKQNERKINAMMRLNRMQDKRTQKIRTLSLIQGQEEERRRISRDIHDGIGQMLTALKLNIENFDESSFSTKKESAKYNRVKELIRETIVEVRRISNALAPPGLYDFGLYSVTKQLLEQLSKTSEIKIHFDSNIQNLRYLPLVEVTLYRIIQESINNTLKHSKAGSIELTLNQDDESLNLIIFDDGVGLNYSDEEINQNKYTGNGLKNIKERAIFIGAKLNIISKPNEGCIINLSIPVKNCTR